MTLQCIRAPYPCIRPHLPTGQLSILTLKYIVHYPRPSRLVKPVATAGRIPRIPHGLNAGFTCLFSLAEPRRVFCTHKVDLHDADIDTRRYCGLHACRFRI